MNAETAMILRQTQKDSGAILEIENILNQGASVHSAADWLKNHTMHSGTLLTGKALRVYIETFANVDWVAVVMNVV